MEDRLLDVKQASAMLGLKPSTLYQWAYKHRIPVVKLFGRALRFRRSVIEKLINDSDRPARVQPPPVPGQPAGRNVELKGP